MSTPAAAPFLECVRLRGNPVADPAATVVRGHARFTILTARLVRLEWSATGVFEDRATFAFPHRAAPPPPFTVAEDGDGLTIDTGALQIRYQGGSGPFAAENLAITLTVHGAPVTWTPGMANPGNLRGARRTLDGAAGPVTLSPGLVSRDGWALHDDSAGVVFTEGGAWVAARPNHDLQDWYFFGYGHAYTEALAEYTRFGGAIPLIPRYVLGAWWSRYWAYSAEDLQQLVADFTAHDLPLDVLVVDMDWHTPDSWTGYTWNRDLFPDPEGFLRWTHERGLQVTLNLHPAEGVQAFEEIYPRFAAALGHDPATGEPVPFRPGDPVFMQQYFELLHHPMEDQGVDFWWIDWQQGEASDIRGLDPLIWLNHLHFQDAARQGRRPLLYSRWGGLGNHRYVIGFSGDTFATWPMLAFLPHFTATAANLLYGWWSHDIGGHFGATPPEQFARWVQYGALSPCLRLHASKDPQAERRPWTFPPPVFAAAHAAFHLRYQLVPYLYTMARAATDTGLSLCRPLYYTYPEAEEAYVARDQYFLGDQVIAAPITRPADPATGLAAADVWVPPGAWIDYQTRETFTGPRWVRLVGDLDRVPLLLRAGAILPLARPAATTAALPADELILAVFPGPAGAFRLYEDDGTTLAYQQGQQEWTPITMATDAAGACRVQIGPVEGRCDALPPERGDEVRFVGTRRPERVLLGAEETADWTYDADAQTTVVRIPRRDKRRALTLTVEAGGGIAAPAAARNQARILADVQRLLGDQYPNVPWENLSAAVLALDHPGRADALARLGGPFVHWLEHTTLPEAAQSLGGLIVAAPRDGSAVDVTVTWALHTPEETEVRVHTREGVQEDTILWNPFTFPGTPQPVRWEAEVLLHWRGGALGRHYRGAWLCPAIPAWRAAVYEAADLAAPLPAVLDWQTTVADPAAEAALTDPLRIPWGATHRAQLDAGASLAAVAVTTITSPVERTVRLAFGGSEQFVCRLNDQPVAEAPPGTAPPQPEVPLLFWEVRMTEPVRLRAGANTLEVRVAPGRYRHSFGLTAAVLEVEGSGATGLHYAPGPPPEEK